MLSCFPCFRRNNYSQAALDPSQQKQNNDDLKNNEPQTFGASAPPMAIAVSNLDGTTTNYGGIDFSGIVNKIDAETDQKLKSNEARYAAQIKNDMGLQSIADATHRSTITQLRQKTQFAETDKKNRSTQAILDQAKYAELEALKKRHQDALSTDDTQKKTPI